jgi:hypothetical protein
MEPNPDSVRYGEHYWGVNVSSTRTEYVMADRVDVLPDGSLALIRGSTRMNVVYAPGHWQRVFAASMLDEHPIAIDHIETT